MLLRRFRWFLQARRSVFWEALCPLYVPSSLCAPCTRFPRQIFHKVNIFSFSKLKRPRKKEWDSCLLSFDNPSAAKEERTTWECSTLPNMPFKIDSFPFGLIWFQSLCLFCPFYERAVWISKYMLSALMKECCFDNPSAARSEECDKSGM